MAPPPSQAGKFKPRKPGKRIQVGGAAAASSSAAATTSSSAPTTSSQRTSASSGRGRGGRRRTAPLAKNLPRGDVFFTGNAPPTAAGAGRSTASAAAAARRRVKQEDGTGAVPLGGAAGSSSSRRSAKSSQAASDEVIVGELEESIGAHLQQQTPNTRKKASIKQEEESDEVAKVDLDAAKKKSRSAMVIDTLVDTYDSETSDEEEAKRPNQTPPSHQRSLPPTELPFPLSSAPLGIGQTERMPLYEDAGAKSATRGRSTVTSPTATTSHESVHSPFVDVRQGDLKAEEDAWFLFQFPTRLPACLKRVKQDTTDAPDTVTSSASRPELVTSTGWSSAECATSSTASSDRFDNVLKEAPPGRLGKLVVYKSGKTVLVLGGDDGLPEIRMNVNEGLPCGFVQQAVSINTETGNYTPLGDVEKTVVVTPDIESFASQETL